MRQRLNSAGRKDSIGASRCYWWVSDPRHAANQQPLYPTKLQQQTKKENEKRPVPNGIGSLVLFVQSPIPVHRRYPLLSREARQSGGASGRIYTFIFVLVRTHDKAHHCALRSYRPTAARCSRSVISQTPIGIVCYHSRHRGGLLLGTRPCIMCSHTRGGLRCCTA